MTVEGLGYKPGVVEKAKFEYYSLGKVFNKVLVEKDKKEGLLERLKNIEGKNKEQRERIDELFQIYSKYFNNRSRILFRKNLQWMKIELITKICLKRSTLAKKIVVDLM